MLSVRHYTSSEGYTYLIKPGELGSKNLHFGILNLKPKSKYFDHSADCEVLLIPLSGQCTLLVGHNGNKANGILGARQTVFAGECCAAFIPHHTTYEVLTDTKSVEVAIYKTPSHFDSAAVILEQGQLETPPDYHLHIAENDASCQWVGEAVSFHRFQDDTASAIIETLHPENNSARITLRNNNFLVIPEKTRARLITNEVVYYQLMIKRFTLPQLVPHLSLEKQSH